MNQKEMDLLTFAIGYLSGKLIKKELKVARFEQYISDELAESKPLDGEPHFVPVPAVQDLIGMFTAELVPVLLEEKWTKERMIDLSYKFGEFVALGKITPTTIAVLTNSSTEDFENFCRNSKDRGH